MTDDTYGNNTESQLSLCQHEKDPDLSLMSPTFSLFLNLPPELRRLIWRWTLPDSQVHFIVFGPGILDGKKNTGVQHIKSPPLPAALMVNRESRQVALENLDRFQRFPEACYDDGEERSYGYFNPKADFLHIQDRWQSSHWSFTQAYFPNISICIYRQNNPYYPRISNRGWTFSGDTKLPEELIHVWKRKLALQKGDSNLVMPNIVLALIDKSFTHEPTCHHIWPTGEPPMILDPEKPLDMSVPETARGRNFWEGKNMWQEYLFKEISARLEDEPGIEKYLPRVQVGVMRLMCGCPEVVEPMRSGQYGSYIRHLEGSSGDISTQLNTRSRRLMERRSENYFASRWAARINASNGPTLETS